MMERKKIIISLGIVVCVCFGVLALYEYGKNYNKNGIQGTISEKTSVEKNVVDSSKNQNGIDENTKGATNEPTKQISINELTKKSVKQETSNKLPKEESKQVSATIPIKADKGYVEYIVRQGDTISKIFSEHIVSYTFNNAERLIMKENNLQNSGILKVGMKLRIPSAVDSGYIKHKVVKGESISVIAKKYMGKRSLSDEISLIETLNGKENTKPVEVGQVLLIQKNN